LLPENIATFEAAMGAGAGINPRIPQRSAFALLTSNVAQFREEVQNGPSESVQYELVARR
jgi:hypothetical protein